MAYPTIDRLVRVQVQMQGPSGLPEDVFVNTWYFEEVQQTGAWEDASVQANVWSRLDDFYSTTHAPAAFPITNWLSGDITSVKYVMYPLYIDPPRYPIGEYTAPWSGGSGAALPQEVALVNSFHADNLSSQTSVVRARRRGRHYLGPLAQTAATGIPARPLQALRDAITAASDFMLAEQGQNQIFWCTVSPTQGTAVSPLQAYHRVSGGYVDDAFDTQRSRGIAPSTRDPWGAPIT